MISSVNGKHCIITSYATTPNAQISAFVLHLFVFTSSGARYGMVPQNVLAIASDPGRTIDSPRSPIFTSPLRVKKMFAALTSR